MNESLGWLRLPEVSPALPDLITGLVTDLRAILIRPGLSNAGKLIAISETVDALAPPPGTIASGTAVVLAALTAGDTIATDALEKLAGGPVTARVSRRDREATVAEARALRAPGGSIVHERAGELITASGQIAAHITSLTVRNRMPKVARVRLGMDGGPPTNMPLGMVVAEHDGHREPLTARVDDGDVLTEGRLWLAGLPVALASERVPALFCARVTGLCTAMT